MGVCYQHFSVIGLPGTFNVRGANAMNGFVQSKKISKNRYFISQRQIGHWGEIHMTEGKPEQYCQKYYNS